MVAARSPATSVPMRRGDLRGSAEQEVARQDRPDVPPPAVDALDAPAGGRLVDDVVVVERADLHQLDGHATTHDVSVHRPGVSGPAGRGRDGQQRPQALAAADEVAGHLGHRLGRRLDREAQLVFHAGDGPRRPRAAPAGGCWARRQATGALSGGGRRTRSHRRRVRLTVHEAHGFSSPLELPAVVDVVVASLDGAPALAPVAIRAPCMPIPPWKLQWNGDVAVGIVTSTSAVLPGADLACRCRARRR